jgi:hypothetical protein
MVLLRETVGKGYAPLFTAVACLVGRASVETDACYDKAVQIGFACGVERESVSTDLGIPDAE